MKRIVMAAGFAALAACGPTNPPAATAPSASPSVAAEGIKLYALDCGRFHIKDASSFSDEGVYDGQARDLVDPCYLIRHPTKGDLLWDAGIPGALAGTTTPTGAEVKLDKTLEAQLAEIGLKPADVEFISFSHSHYDHVGEAGLFTGSTWIVDADERTWMFREDARKAPTFAAIAPLEGVKTTLIEGDGDFDVFGDGSAVIVQTPGHTPGHAVLVLKLAKTGPILLAGDMWHLAEARERRTVPKGNVDKAMTLASMDKVEALARATGARVVRQHVPEDFEALPKFPAFAD